MQGNVVTAVLVAVAGSVVVTRKAFRVQESPPKKPTELFLCFQNFLWWHVSQAVSAPLFLTLLASRRLWEQALYTHCLTEVLFQMSSGTFVRLFKNIRFPLANLCEPSLSLNSFLPGSLCPVALWSLGLQCLLISLWLSYRHVCPIYPSWSRNCLQMGPGYCGKSQGLANAERLPFFVLFFLWSHLGYLQLSSLKICHNYLTKPFFFVISQSCLWLHNWPSRGHHTGNAGAAISGVALGPSPCRKVLQVICNIM